MSPILTMARQERDGFVRIDLYPFMMVLCQFRWCWGLAMVLRSCYVSSAFVG